MNDNIYAEIVESDQVVSKLRGKLPTMFESLAYSKSGDNPSQPKKPAKKFLGLTSRDESELQNQHLQQKKMLQQKRYMIHIDSVNKVSQASMLGSSFIVYRIRFTRMSDLESRSTWKRFRDMQSWYQELQKYESTAASCPFPQSHAAWLSAGDQKDPHSEFVLTRKLSLETFLRDLFDKYPALYQRHSQHVNKFFGLDTLPPETMNVIATRVAAREDAPPASYEVTSTDYVFDGKVLSDIRQHRLRYDPSLGCMVTSESIVKSERLTAINDIMDFSVDQFDQYKLKYPYSGMFQPGAGSTSWVSRVEMRHHCPSDNVMLDSSTLGSVDDDNDIDGLEDFRSVSSCDNTCINHEEEFIHHSCEMQMDVTLTCGSSHRHHHKLSFYLFQSLAVNVFSEIQNHRGFFGFHFLLVIISYASYLSKSIISRYLLWNAWYALPSKVQLLVISCNVLFKEILSQFIIRITLLMELLLLFLYIHRILGYIAGYLIRSKLDPEKAGKFNIHIEWISFRIGLDWNQVVIHGIEWRNPPGFINTPWLLRIEEVSMAIDVLSVFRAITTDASVHIQSIFARGVDLHIERYSPSEDPSLENRLPDLKRGALNFNVATGAVDASQECSVMERVNALLKGVMNDSTKFLEAFKNVALYPVSAVKSAADLVGRGIHGLFNKSSSDLDPLKTFSGMMNILKGEDEMQALFLKHDKDGSGFLNKDELKALCRSTGAAVVDDEHLDHLFSILDSSGDDRITYEEFSLWWKNKDKRGIDLKEALSSDEESSKADDYLKNKHESALLGIPYKFEIDNLQISQLVLDIDDLLTANHTKGTSYTRIRLPLFNMFRVDLTLPPRRAKKVNRKRRGIYLDDVMWRVVSKLLRVLAQENTIAVMLLLSSSAARNLTSITSGSYLTAADAAQESSAKNHSGDSQSEQEMGSPALCQRRFRRALI